MKKFLLLLTTMVISFGVVACGDKNNASNGYDESEVIDMEELEPEEIAVVGFLEAVKQADFAKINEYVIEDDMMYSEDTTQDNTEEKIIFENITYKIKSLVSLDTSEEGNEGKATVGVEITNVDINTALQNYQQTVGEKTDMTKEEIIAFVKEAIAQNKDTTITKKVDIDVIQVDEQWKVQTTEELIFALIGGFTGGGGISIDR